MNKFAEWMKNNDKQQYKVAEKIGISAAGMNAILKRGQIPNLKIACAIEEYTKGEVKVYDWIENQSPSPEKINKIPRAYHKK